MDLVDTIMAAFSNNFHGGILKCKTIERSVGRKKSLLWTTFSCFTMIPLFTLLSLLQYTYLLLSGVVEEESSSSDPSSRWWGVGKWRSSSSSSFVQKGQSRSTNRIASAFITSALSSVRGGTGSGKDDGKEVRYGRISRDEFRLTPEQIETFHREGCLTVPDVLTTDEVDELVDVFDRFVAGEIKVPGKDFCDISKPFGTPYKDWSLVNCMLPTRYHPPFRGNVFERLAASMSQQLFPDADMTKDYDQFLNKRPGKEDAVFAMHQDMAYWPNAKALKGVNRTETCTFSLALDDSSPENGCLQYVSGSGTSKTLFPHRPLIGNSREEGHALTIDFDVEDDRDKIRLAPARKGSITIHDEYVVHGSGGNTSRDRQRRTYVVAFRAGQVVAAERSIGFTHSHNDDVNWDTFQDDVSHRVKADKQRVVDSVTKEQVF